MGKKKAKKRPQGKYSADHIETVRMLVLQCGMVNGRGEIAWSKIAKYLKVTAYTLRRWRNPAHKDYKKEFAESLGPLQEDVDIGRVKTDTIRAAGRHILHKTVREPQIDGPAPVRAGYGKSELVEYAATILEPSLNLDSSMSKPAMLVKIDAAITKQTKRKMVVVRTEAQERMGQPAAQALVHANLGPEDERWIVKEGRVHEATGSLGRLLDELADVPTVLPVDELSGKNGDDTRGTGTEYEEPVVAAEPPVLDNGSNGPTD